MDQALLMKEKGNACFAKHKYSAAIDFYTEAICLKSDVAAFYTNRALSYLHLEKWALAQTDCRRAIQLDASNAKAHYLLGKSLCHNSEYTAGIEAFQAALALAAQSSQLKVSFEQEVLAGLRQARKLKWQAAHDIQTSRHERVTALFHDIVHQSRTHQLHCANTSAPQTKADIHNDHDTVLAHMMELLELQVRTY
ncbi:hypothetical protein, variant [Aphanomyces astaci]|uniref:RING-type E3 ubiquitin transferase n=1 Tax=Aphanomyces astaci TaxID=112090 RepID=W4G876_APHAT|nr:hypothetical protein, variant [Aphanomyces astaci]ETV75880.1 hypothetical protein, variant [Aphanomyces astaci]|eukprot:XP_009834521.1 hypothetical protein, variant [Aphanomyces astaci]